MTSLDYRTMRAAGTLKKRTAVTNAYLARPVGFAQFPRYSWKTGHSPEDRLSSRVARTPESQITGDIGFSRGVYERPRPKEISVVTSMPGGTNENDERLQLAAQGDAGSWEALVAESRHRLRRMVAFRLDQRLQGRVDPSDVLQDAYLEAWHKL